MTPRYLTSVRISNFRTYGPEFSLSFPAGPGLTVVCGMNGLGKTTLFDAIEWAILGDIQRFGGQSLSTATSPLTRREAPKNSHQVTLEWGNQSVVRDHSQPPDESLLRQILVDPHWGFQVRDLAVYLRLTHFLPQSSGQRFLRKDDKERWSLLKGPAGVERLEHFRRMLDDKKARNAFERRIEVLKLLEATAVREKETWIQMLAERKRWAALAQAGSAITPEEAEVFLQGLSANHSSGDVVQRLATTRQEIFHAVQQNEARMAVFDSQEKIISRHADLVEHREALRLAISGLGPRLVQSEAEIATLRLQLETERKKLRDGEDARNSDNARAMHLLSVIDAIAKREEQQHEAKALNERERLQNVELTQLRNQAETNRRIVTERENLVQRANTVRERLSNLDFVDRLAGDFRTQNQQAEIFQKEIGALEGQKKALISEQAVLEIEFAATEGKFKEAVSELEKSKRASNAIAAARATIVEHIDAEDRICPICAHEHPPGELLKHAREKFQVANRRIGTLLESMKELENRQGGIRSQQQKVRTALGELDLGIARRNQQIESAAVSLKLLLTHPLIAGVAISDVEPRLKQLRSEFSAQQQEVATQLVRAKPVDELGKTSQELEQREKTTQESLRLIQSDIVTLSKRIQESDTKLKASEKLIAEVGGTGELVNARNALLRGLSELEVALKQTSARIELLQSREANLERSFAELVARRKADQLALDSHEKELGLLAKVWINAGLEGMPSSITLATTRTRLEQTILAQKQSLDRLQQVVVGLEVWNNRKELILVTNAMEATRQRFRAQTDGECSTRLNALAAQSTLAVERASRASLRAGRIADELLRRSAEFSDAALDPLSQRISAFHQLISPFRYKVEMKPRLTGTSGKAQTKLVVPSLMGAKSTDEDPDLWLSEGQASALGLSVLLGSSTVYRWSAWRALLLDDPLQNTDLIHAAAFGDIIRSLMQDDGYQVILSTHSSDEADFLLRKVRRAGLPVQCLELVSLSPDGVRYELRD